MKSNLVKIFLVLNLLLSVAVVGASVKLFQDRELIKARRAILRQNVSEIAENLDWGQTVPGEESDVSNDAPFQLLDPNSMAEVPSFTDQLEELSALAESRVAQLDQQFAEVTEAQGQLEEARSTLVTRESEVADIKGRLENREKVMADTQKSIKDRSDKLASLEQENTSLQQQVDSLDTQISNQQTTISKIQEKLEMRTAERDRVRELLAACRNPGTTEEDDVPEWHEKTAQILAVVPEWNYVVINRGEVDVLPVFLEAFVHRGDEFVGKIRVTQVDRTVALAEIISDTLSPGMMVQAGDTIFF